LPHGLFEGDSFCYAFDFLVVVYKPIAQTTMKISTMKLQWNKKLKTKFPWMAGTVKSAHLRAEKGAPHDFALPRYPRSNEGMRWQ